MDNELKEIICKIYGQQCKKDYEELEKKLTVVIAAHLFAGMVGDNPLVKVNQAIASARVKK